jgi:predicted membrane protein
MFSGLYLKFGIIGIVLAILGGVWYNYHYAPLKELKQEKKDLAKELRAEYIKNSALELELVMCLDDKNVTNFEGEMKGFGDAIEDDNFTSVSDKLIF